ncbi:MAG: aminotransferase class I/II-fold pyridoxal phosphate-dependent enzyme [Rhodospirillales bacterium]|nr:aminotransferase class I/II-fold pyridoxal phosphate-dependent enzyme [Rhodospirillales bacterium]
MSSFIPLSVPDLSGNEAASVAACVRDTWVSSAGPAVTAFESRVAALCGRSHGVATSSGTTALHLALIVAGVGPGDHVIIPDWTFAATANAVIHAGAIPYFVDITSESWTIDAGSVEQALAQFRGGRIAAIVTVHALGHPAHMERLTAVGTRFGVPVIEDAAGAIGARYHNHPVGGIGDAAIFSFNGNKVLTAGGGGMMVTDNEAWAARARSLSTQARDGVRYRYREAGFNCRMPNINAALGLSQFDHLDDMLKAKRRIADTYDDALRDRADLQSMPRCPWAQSNNWLYSVLCASRDDADGLVNCLQGDGIEARVFWETLSDQTPYSAFPRSLTGVAAAISGRVVSLPSSSSLGEADQSRVLAALAQWRGNPVMRFQ